MIAYKIFGLPGADDGLPFASCVNGLEKKPYLWADECPFPIPAQVEPRVVAISDLDDLAADDADPRSH